MLLIVVKSLGFTSGCKFHCVCILDFLCKKILGVVFLLKFDVFKGFSTSSTKS